MRDCPLSWMRLRTPRRPLQVSPGSRGWLRPAHWRAREQRAKCGLREWACGLRYLRRLLGLGELHAERVQLGGVLGLAPIYLFLPPRLRGSPQAVRSGAASMRARVVRSGRMTHIDAATHGIEVALRALELRFQRLRLRR